MYESKGLDLDTVIKKFSPVVQRLAHNMVATIPPNVEVGDMIQAGLEGLMHAQKTYKPGTGVPFTNSVNWLGSTAETVNRTS